MEKLDIEIPVSVGDKVYRTTNTCDIITGIVTHIDVDSVFYRTDGKNYNKHNVKFTVDWSGSWTTTAYTPDDLGVSIFPTRKGLIKHIVESL